jgi:hypothetical protein
MTTVRKRGLLLYLFEELFLNFCKKKLYKTNISTNRLNKKIDRIAVKVNLDILCQRILTHINFSLNKIRNIIIIK